VAGAGLPRAVPPGRPRLILQALAHDGADVTFTGLRRRLGLHPQALTRELRRLEEAGTIEHDRTYRLTELGRAALHDAMPQEHDAVELVRLLLPPDLDAQDVEAALAGRWFEALRWYGRGGGPGEVVLMWITQPDGILVRLRIIAGVAVVEAESAWDDGAQAFAALQPLLAALAPLFGARRPAHVAEDAVHGAQRMDARRRKQATV
jgi:hypothetical protein